MLIEEQIKKLQRIKAKIDLYRKVQGNVQDELASVNQDPEHKALEDQYPGLLSEFCSEVGTFCTKRIEQLGNNGGEAPRQALVQAPQEAEAPKSKPIPPIALIDDEPADPLRFLMKYKHFDGKRVTWVSKDGPVQGTVRGLLTPNVIVETDGGFTLPVPARELKVV